MRLLPIFEGLPRCARDDIAGDLMAAAVVAIMLVPQSMAYAVLCGLPLQVGLYASIVGASFTGGYPVTGGFSPPVVTSEAGATTSLASVATAMLVALTVAFLTPMFFYIPHALLAAPPAS